MEAVLQFRSEHTTVGDTRSFGQRQLQEPCGGLQAGHVGILLVDDDDDVRFVLQDMLEDAGYRVYSVASGLEAISFFRDNHDLIDLLISDVVMPMMDGREVYEQLNKLRPGLSAVFITGYSSDILKQLQWAENVKLLEKPLQFTTLMQTIQEICI